MSQGESLQERVRLMRAMPSQMLQEGAGRLPSLPLPSPSEGIWGETQAGAGQGEGLAPVPWLQMAAFLLCAHVACPGCVHAEDK